MSVSAVNVSCDRSLEKRCLNAANHLIIQCKAHVPPVDSISDIDSNLIVLLFERITDFQIPDLLSHTHKIEEAHNVQAVIDTLSLDLLGISLSHITGEDVVAGNVIAICNLLEVLHGVLSARSSTFDNKNKKFNLKKKVSQKRKSQSQLSSEKKKSSNKASSSVNSVTNTKVLGKVKQASLNQPHPLDALLEQLQKEQPRRLSSRIRQHDKNGRQSVASQKQDDKSSTKSPPKLLKRTNGKRTEENEKHSDVKNPVVEVDGNRAVHGKTLRHSERHLKHKGIQNEVKPHFQVEPVDNKTKLVRKERKIITPKKIKRKTVKLVSSGSTVKPVENDQEIETLYEKNLERKIRVIVEKNSYITSRASRLKKWHLQSVRKPVRKTPISACRKSFLLPHTLRQRSISRTALKRIATNKIQPHCSSQKQNDNSIPVTSKSGFIQELFEDFPGLELPPTLINRITNKYQQHLTRMHKKAKKILLMTPKTQIQADEAAMKQSALSNIIKKDAKHQQYMKEFKENKENENKMKYYLRDARIQMAKMKHYSNEFQVEMGKKMQKRNFAEELIFENVFEDALNLQKDQLDHLCKEVKRTGENDGRKQLIYLDALENLYQTQFTLMSETLASERRDTQERVKAEKQAMDIMQREFQEELKQEIRFMQQAIIECTEEAHFREMDANQYIEKLRKRLS